MINQDEIIGRQSAEFAFHTGKQNYPDELARLARLALMEMGGFDDIQIISAVRDLKNLTAPLTKLLKPNARPLFSKTPFLAQDIVEESSPSPYTVHAAIPLRARGAVVGIVVVDNSKSKRSIQVGSIKHLQPFLRQVAMLLANSDINDERERILIRRDHIMRVASQISMNQPLDDILRMLRDGVVQSGCFDRAGIWLVDGDHLQGAWGTDVDGSQLDERHIRVRIVDRDPRLAHLLDGSQWFILSNRPAENTSEISRSEILIHAIIALRSNDQTIAILSVDNLISGNSIQFAEINLVMPLVHQAAVAIQNALLVRDLRISLGRQRKLMEIAAGMNAHLELDAVLRLVRDAVVEASGFDRAAVQIYDSVNKTISGTWGTNAEGHPQNYQGVATLLADEPTPIISLILDGKEPYFLYDNYTVENGISEDHDMYGVRKHGVIPLKAANIVIGMLCVDNLLSDRPITRNDLERLMPLAEQAAVAISNARLFEQLGQAQDALLRSEKLRALGELAGGVAHNINNVLTAVLGYAELITRMPEASEKIVRYANIISKAGKDGAEIVRRVQQFAQFESHQLDEEYDLSKVALDAIELTQPLWQSSAESHGTILKIVSDCPAGIMTNGIAGEIKEAVVNIIRNAIDAQPNGGEIAVKTGSHNGEVYISISDTGCGMKDEVKQQIFLPFFTTKGMAVGMGLGLSTAWGAVARQKGSIEVESAPNKGSTFIIRFPSAVSASGSRVNDCNSPSVRLDGISLLLVDDEEMVLRSLDEGFQELGATVSATNSPFRAMDMVRSGDTHWDVIITDHGMAEMTGLLLLNLIKQEAPKVRRILISGWGHQLAQTHELHDVEALLSKPITVQSAARTILELLQR